MDSNKAKKRGNIGDGPLRIDHSDVYFENDRLAEELGIVKNILLKYKHRQHLNRDGEIKELRRTIGTLEAMKKSSHHTLLNKRPQTTPAYIGRPQRPLVKPEAPPPARVVKLNVHIPNEDSDDSDSDTSEFSDDSSLNSMGHVTKMKPTIRPPVLTKTELMLTKAGTKKFPTSWYTDVLEPSDTVVKKNPSAPTLGRTKSAGNKLRRGKQIRRKSSAVNEEADDRPQLVCGRSKSAVLSRRKLIEMTNLDHIADPEEKEEPVQILRQRNKEHTDLLQTRVKQFLDDLDDLKKRQISVRRASRFTGVYGNDSFYSSHQPLW